MKVFDFIIKKSVLLAVVLLYNIPILKGQNLVINPGFEIPKDSNTLISPGEYAIWKTLGWSMPTRAQATLYSSIPTLATTNRSLSKWKFTAKEGNNVVGIMTYGIVSGEENKELREYIQGSLSKPLVVGKKYYVSYWIHFHCEGTNNIGIALSVKPVSIYNVARLELKPAINHTEIINYKNGGDWVQIRDSFIAKEPSKHFIIGNFFSNNDTKVQSNKFHYHKAYFDDIVIEEASNIKMLPRPLETNDNTLVSNGKINDNPVTQSTTSAPSVKEVTNSPNKTFESITNISKPTDKMSTPADAKPVGATNGTAKGEVLILDKVYFYIGSSRFKGESTAQLNKLLLYLQQNEDIHILVKGHTSSDGSNEFNLKLSQSRSKAVVDFLISKGIKSNRLSYKGFGESMPLESNDTENGRQQNRRVEFEIID